MILRLLSCVGIVCGSLLLGSYMRDAGLLANAATVGNVAYAGILLGINIVLNIQQRDN